MNCQLVEKILQKRAQREKQQNIDAAFKRKLCSSEFERIRLAQEKNVATAVANTCYEKEAML